MNLLLILVLQSAPVLTGQELLQRYDTFDLVRMETRVEPERTGARVRCDITVEGRRDGPVRLIFTRQIRGLTVERDGAKVEATLEAVPLEPLVRTIAPGAPSLPGLLTLPAVRATERVTYRLQYLWRPRGEVATARGGFIQTHMASFWVPMKANERFDSVVEIRTPYEAIAAGRKKTIEGGYRFTSKTPVQAVGLVAGRFRKHVAGDVEVYLPPDVREDAARIADDTKRALALFDDWFGPRPTPAFRVVVDPVRRPMPSYCGGNFVVIAYPARPGLQRSRTAWLSLIAHECAHAWWGHRVGMPILGDGGNWLREGLAQWAGIEAVAHLGSKEDAARLWRAHARAYLGTADVRRDGVHLFANEPTLLSATYLDPPRVPYWRGALVLRRMAHRLGAEEFRRRLATLAKDRAAGFVGMKEFAQRFDAQEDVAYYAARNRLPDLVLDGNRIRCADPDFPDGPIPVRIDGRDVDVPMKNGEAVLSAGAKNVEVDPERILLDPLR